MASVDQELPNSSHSGNRLTWSIARKLTVICTGFCACLTCTGLIFGYAAIQPSLVANGAFHELCEDWQTVLVPCDKQKFALAGMFTVASSAMALAAWPMGALLDYFGPRTMGACLTFMVAVGCVMFSWGGSGLLGNLAYYGGFLVMGVCGTPVFLCTTSFANLFPKRQGLILAGMVGLFDASSSVFIFLAKLIQDLSIPDALEQEASAHPDDVGHVFGMVFKCYATIPLAVTASAIMLWPRVPIPSDDNQVTKGSDDNQADRVGEDVTKRSPAKRVSVSAKASEAIRLLPFGQQIRRKEYLLFVQTAGISMLCINFFIATIDGQVVDVSGPDGAIVLQKTFAILLPLGGLVYTPPVGFIVDHLGLTRSWIVLWVALQLCMILNMLSQWFHVPAAAYASFAIIPFARCLFYTLLAAFTGSLFGAATFGRVYGSMTFLAGIANMGVQPLQIIANMYGFSVANMGLYALQSTTVLLPLFICRQHNPRRGITRENSLKRQTSFRTAGMTAAYPADEMPRL